MTNPPFAVIDCSGAEPTLVGRRLSETDATDLAESHHRGGQPRTVVTDGRYALADFIGGCNHVYALPDHPQLAA